jgi:protein gp37
MNKANGNMYTDVTHTHNVVKGVCPHGCTYCYMNKLYKRGWLKEKPLYLDENELKKNLGTGNIIFVGSSCDMWADSIPEEWIRSVFLQLIKYPNNSYLFQTKNPSHYFGFLSCFELIHCTLGITLETNRWYHCMGNAKSTYIRTEFFKKIHPLDKFITIEPILDFDLFEFAKMLKSANPDYINIGADSGNNHLPEPSKEKVLELISELEKFTRVVQKKNLERIIGGNNGTV